jgi:hypothetical protein
MKLKPVRAYPAVVIKGRVPGELHRALTAYTTFYRETTKQEIELWPLLLQMLQQFVETDRDFQMWRRRTDHGPGSPATTS